MEEVCFSSPHFTQNKKLIIGHIPNTYSVHVEQGFSQEKRVKASCRVGAFVWNTCWLAGMPHADKTAWLVSHSYCHQLLAMVTSKLIFLGFMQMHLQQHKSLAMLHSPLNWVKMIKYFSEWCTECNPPPIDCFGSTVRHVVAITHLECELTSTFGQAVAVFGPKRN